MESFSGLLLELYRLAQDAPAEKFQTRTLDRMREDFGFDSAFWATGVVKPGEGVTINTHCLYRQPPEMLESWMRINKNVEMTFEAFRQQGTTINAALCGPYWQSRYSQEGRKHIERYGKAHCLLTIIAEPVLRIWMGVGFYRADPKHPFTEDERLLKQNLTPHLAEAWNISRFGFVTSARNNGTQAGNGRAICDSKGVLYNADRNFTGFMLAEWPDWQGPQLPHVLLDTISGKGRSQYTGHGFVASAKALNDMLLLCVRRKSTVDQLSPREFDVARQFGHGMNHRKIAEQLHIAPVTVRNHLQAIYAKLGVSNKVELARIIFLAGD